jgi:hypothetical protein
VITPDKIAKARRMLEEVLKAQLGPVAKKEIAEWLARPVAIEGAMMTVRTTLGAWLRLVKAATEAGWEPKSGLHEVAEEDARAFSAALDKADMNGQNWWQLVLVARLVGRLGWCRQPSTARIELDAPCCCSSRRALPTGVAKRLPMAVWSTPQS